MHYASISFALLLLGALEQPGRCWAVEPGEAAQVIDLGSREVQLYPGESRHAVDVPFQVPDGMTFVVDPPTASSWNWLEAEVAGVAPRNPLPPLSSQVLRLHVSTDGAGVTWTGVAMVAGTVAGSPARITIAATATVADYIVWPQPAVGELVEVQDGGVETTRTMAIRRGRHAQPFDAIVVDTNRPDAVTVAVTALDADNWQLRETTAVRGLSGVIMVQEAMHFTQGGRPCPYVTKRTLRLHAHGALEAQPKAILFGACPAGASASCTIRLFGRDKAIAARTTDSQQVACQLQRGGDEQELVATFTARIDAGIKGASFPGYCIVERSNGGVLMIPYFAAVLPRLQPPPPLPAPPPTEPAGF